MVNCQKITQEMLKELLNYDSGRLYWKYKRKGIKTDAKTKFGYPSGVNRIQINKELMLTHRAIFLFHKGHLPELIDHINRIGSDHRIENLRECTSLQNQHNMSRFRNNSTGIKGLVYRGDRPNKWKTRVMCNGVAILNKSFLLKVDAINALEKIRKEYHGEFACNG